MIRGLSRIVPKVIVSIWLAMGFVIAQTVSAEEKVPAAAPTGEPTVTSSSVVLPLVQGTAAFAVGDFAGALGHFEPVEREMHRIGGSHAQWELFEETMVVCYLELARYDDALRLVRRRLARRASPRDAKWLARASAGLGGP